MRSHWSTGKTRILFKKAKTLASNGEPVIFVLYYSKVSSITGYGDWLNQKIDKKECIVPTLTYALRNSKEIVNFEFSLSIEMIQGTANEINQDAQFDNQDAQWLSDPTDNRDVIASLSVMAIVLIITSKNYESQFYLRNSVMRAMCRLVWLKTKDLEELLESESDEIFFLVNYKVFSTKLDQFSIIWIQMAF